MSYTTETAVTQVRSILNEATAVFWTDDELQNWLAEGTLLFSTISLCVEADDELTLVANQLRYDSGDESFIANVVELYGAYYNDQSNNFAGMIAAHPRMLGHLDTFTAGDPKYIMLHNHNIYIWPLTTAAIVTAGGTVQVLYSKATNDIEDLPDEFQLYPIIYAEAKAKQKDRREAEASALFSQFFSMANFERADKHARETDSFDKFLIPTGTQQAQATRKQ